MLKSILKISTVFALLATLLFTACQKDDLVVSEDNFTLGDPLLGQGPRGPRDTARCCFEFVFPISVELPNGDTLEINGEREHRNFIERWKNANVNGRPTIIFPIEVTLANGSNATINTPEELKRLIESCLPDRPTPTPCYKVIFPVRVKLPNDSTIAINSADAFAALLKRWRSSHPNADRHPQIVFPYGVEKADGTIVRITGAEDLRRILAACNPGPDLRPCFDVIFPAKVKLPSGVVVEIRSADAFRELIERWVKNNPLSTERPELVFPYRVKTKNGRTEVLKDKEDLRKLLANCQ